MRRNVTRIYKGEAGLKDYDVRKCMADGDKMEVTFEGDKMTLSCEELTSKRGSVSAVQKSKYPGGKDYRLIGYEWNPDEVEL
jgi:hypothetical protein